MIGLTHHIHSRGRITRWNGFTLVELLLVLVLMGVALGIAMPHFVHSIRGNRLRVAGRTLTTVTRYARSMAVLKQTSINLMFDLDDCRIEVVSSNATLPKFARAVDGVQIESVTLSESEQFHEGVCLVPFYRNGMCRPFTVKITDEHGGRLTIKVDALADSLVTGD